MSEKEVSDAFDDWYENVNTASGSYEEISEKEAQDEGIDEDYSE